MVHELPPLHHVVCVHLTGGVHVRHDVNTDLRKDEGERFNVICRRVLFCFEDWPVWRRAAWGPWLTWPCPSTPRHCTRAAGSAGRRCWRLTMTQMMMIMRITLVWYWSHLPTKDCQDCCRIHQPFSTAWQDHKGLLQKVKRSVLSDDTKNYSPFGHLSEISVPVMLNAFRPKAAWSLVSSNWSWRSWEPAILTLNYSDEWWIIQKI